MVFSPLSIVWLLLIAASAIYLGVQAANYLILGEVNRPKVVATILAFFSFVGFLYQSLF